MPVTSGRPWEDGRIPLRGIFSRSTEWKQTHWIGYEKGRKAFRNTAYTEALKRREDFPYHSDEHHKRLLAQKAITSSHWLLVIDAEKGLIEVHGIKPATAA